MCVSPDLPCADGIGMWSPVIGHQLYGVVRILFALAWRCSMLLHCTGMKCSYLVPFIKDPSIGHMMLLKLDYTVKCVPVTHKLQCKPITCWLAHGFIVCLRTCVAGCMAVKFTDYMTCAIRYTLLMLACRDVLHKFSCIAINFSCSAADLLLVAHI